MNDLLLENIHKTFPIRHGRGKQVVLDSISLRVRPGERWGIVGPNGAGKSTIIQIISGSLTPDSGTVHRGRSLSASTLPSTAPSRWTSSSVIPARPSRNWAGSAGQLRCLGADDG